MTPLKINGVETGYWYHLVMKHSFDFGILHDRVEHWNGIKGKEYWQTGEIMLPPGKWEIIGCVSSTDIEEGVKVLAEKVAEFGDEKKPETYGCLWRNYLYDVPQPVTFTFGTWQESVRSLFTHNKIEIPEGMKALVLNNSIKNKI